MNKNLNSAWCNKVYMPVFSIVVLTITLLLVSCTQSASPADSCPPSDHKSNPKLMKRLDTLFETHFLPSPASRRGVDEWQVLKSADDIPSGGRGIRQPEAYCDIVVPPIEEVIAENRQVITLYAWTPYNGILARWELTVEDDTVVFAYAEAVDMSVGDVSQIYLESVAPSPGEVLINTEISIPLDAK